ncbi:MAG: type II toxin-antitoxin system VapC family toxin [Chloroflexota bacterium]|nr:type II toxin-antitoxin system VapC family toxin [Chloroflexota bacterium]
MNEYLLDTNAVSELTKYNPNPSVINYLNSQTALWLSVIVIQELELGVQLLPEGRRRNRLRIWLSGILDEFDGRILPIGRREAEWAAIFQARVRKSGGRLKLGDALIAGTAMANDMTVVTRNIRDFEGLDVEIVNPWETS